MILPLSTPSSEPTSPLRSASDRNGHRRRRPLVANRRANRRTVRRGRSPPGGSPQGHEFRHTRDRPPLLLRRRRPRRALVAHDAAEVSAVSLAKPMQLAFVSQGTDEQEQPPLCRHESTGRPLGQQEIHPQATKNPRPRATSPKGRPPTEGQGKLVPQITINGPQEVVFT